MPLIIHELERQPDKLIVLGGDGSAPSAQPSEAAVFPSALPPADEPQAPTENITTRRRGRPRRENSDA